MSKSVKRWEMRQEHLANWTLVSLGAHSNMHQPTTVAGTCFDLALGPVTVTTVVAQVEGFPASDCHTGWETLVQLAKRAGELGADFDTKGCVDFLLALAQRAFANARLSGTQAGLVGAVRFANAQIRSWRRP